LLLGGGDKNTQQKDIQLAIAAGPTGKREQMRDRPDDEAMAEEFHNDPTYALGLLNDIFKDGDQGELLVTLRQMAKALGGIQAIAAQADLNATQLYRTLSEDGNPALSSLTAVLKAMGLRLAMEPVKAA